LAKIDLRSYRPIPGYENYTINRKGQVYSLKSKKHVSVFEDNSGRATVSLYSRVKLGKHGEFRNWNKHISKLLGEVFLPNPKEGSYIQLKDNNKTNLSLTNLKRSTSSFKRKVSDVVIKKILADREKGFSPSELRQKYPTISKYTLKTILYNNNYYKDLRTA
jgi:hypothetical protein